MPNYIFPHDCIRQNDEVKVGKLGKWPRELEHIRKQTKKWDISIGLRVMETLIALIILYQFNFSYDITDK